MANFEDVIQILIDTNKKLIDGQIDIKVAQHVSSSTQVLINAARLQLDIFKATNNAQRFIEPQTAINDLKQIAKEAEELNHKYNDDLIDGYKGDRLV